MEWNCKHALAATTNTRLSQPITTNPPRLLISTFQPLFRFYLLFPMCCRPETWTIGLLPYLLPHIFGFLKWRKVSELQQMPIFSQQFSFSPNVAFILLISSWFGPVWCLLVTLTLTLTNNSFFSPNLLCRADGFTDVFPTSLGWIPTSHPVTPGNDPWGWPLHPSSPSLGTECRLVAVLMVKVISPCCRCPTDDGGGAGGYVNRNGWALWE